jgi:hypothetical protein
MENRVKSIRNQPFAGRQLGGSFFRCSSWQKFSPRLHVRRLLAESAHSLRIRLSSIICIPLPLLQSRLSIAACRTVDLARCIACV